MRIHSFPLVCDVCGGEGVGTIRTAGAAWEPGSEIRHNNPAVCAAHLARRKRDLDRREAVLSSESER